MDASMKKLIRKLKGLGVVVLVCAFIILAQAFV